MSETSSSAPQRIFDWEGAYARLADIQAKLEASDNPAAVDIERTLRQRAAAYARPKSAEVTPEWMEVIEFEIDDERLAIGLASGAAASSLAGLTILPGVPAFYLGLLSYRGVVYPIIDIRRLIGRATGGDKDMRYAVLMRSEHGTIGLAATDILGITKFQSDHIALNVEHAEHRIIHGIGPNSTTIIDATRLLQDIRLTVDDQPDVVIRTGGEGA